MACRLVALAVVPVLLGLSACARVHQSIDIHGDNDVRYSIDVGLGTSVAASARIGPQQICAGYQPGAQGLPAAAQVQVYDDGRYLGCTINYTGTVARSRGVVTHQGRTWQFRLQGNQQGAKSVPAQLDPADIDDFRVAVTFPGAVTGHNGSSTVSGRTVTWTRAADWLSPDGLQATANDGVDWTLLGFVWIAAQLVVFGIGWLLLGRRPRGGGPRAYAGGRTFVG